MQSLNDIIKTMVDRGDDVVTGIGNAFQSLSDIIKNVDTVYHGVTLVVLSHDKRMQIEDSHQHSDLHATNTDTPNAELGLFASCELTCKAGCLRSINPC
eukprot:scaffold50704_cov22-Cyclotella_meneghiniana.AAC.1